MNCRQWVWLLLTSACLIGAAPGAPAQTIALSEDKLVILEQLPKPAGANLEDLFKHLNNSSQDMNLAEQLRKSGVTAEQLKILAESPNLPDLIQEMQKNLGSDSSKIPPQLREALKGMSKDKIQSTLSKERLQQLQQAVARSGQGKGLRPGASIDKKGSPPARPPVPVKPNVGGGATPAESANPISPDGRTNATPDPSNSQQDSALSQGIMNWARSMQRIDPSLAESPALRKAIRELSRHIGENDPRWDKLGQNASAIKEKWSNWSEALHLEHLLPKDGISWPRSLTPPALPHWHRAHDDSALVRGNFSGKSPTAATTSLETKGWQGLLTGLVLGVIGVIAWNVLFRNQGTEEEHERRRAELGPWPVKPAAVTTREELIRAFEYLSLLWLGPPARNWNHQVIAERMGEEDKAGPDAPELMSWDAFAQRQAAGQLAALYERARYAPPGEPLPDDALAAARRDLCFLAGMPAS